LSIPVMRLERRVFVLLLGFHKEFNGFAHMRTKGIKVIFIAQVLLGCGIVFFSFFGSHAAVLRHARVNAYERLLRESAVHTDTSQILDMTPLEFASLASVVARNAEDAYDTLLLCGVVVIVFGIAGIILVRKNTVKHSV
jgi:hypothetical protein